MLLSDFDGILVVGEWDLAKDHYSEWGSIGLLAKRTSTRAVHGTPSYCLSI